MPYVRDSRFNMSLGPPMNGNIPPKLTLLKFQNFNLGYTTSAKECYVENQRLKMNNCTLLKHHIESKLKFLLSTLIIKRQF